MTRRFTTETFFITEWFFARCTWTCALLGAFLVTLGCDQSADPANTSRTSAETSVDSPTDSSDSTTGSDPKPDEDANEDTEVVKVGDEAPDFEIEAMGGQSLRLSRYFGESNGPTVLLFDRAHW